MNEFNFNKWYHEKRLKTPELFDNDYPKNNSYIKLIYNILNYSKLIYYDK